MCFLKFYIQAGKKNNKTRLSGIPRPDEAAIPTMPVQRPHRNVYNQMDRNLADIERELEEINTLLGLKKKELGDENIGILRKWMIKKTSDKFVTKWITEKSIELKQQDACPICLEYFKISDKTLTLSCQHIFHYNCTKQWFEKKTECPKCRRKYD